MLQNIRPVKSFTLPWLLQHSAHTFLFHTLRSPTPPPGPYLAADDVGTNVHEVRHIVERQVVLQESPKVWDGLIRNDPAGGGEEQAGA